MFKCYLNLIESLSPFSLKNYFPIGAHISVIYYNYIFLMGKAFCIC